MEKKMVAGVAHHNAGRSFEQWRKHQPGGRTFFVDGTMLKNGGGSLEKYKVYDRPSPRQPASRQKKKKCMKSCSPTESGRSKSCLAKIFNEKVVCAAQLFKDGGRKLYARPNFQKRLPALIKKASVGRHAHNKCIASGQQKRSVGHAFVCGSAERCSNCHRCYRDYSAQTTTTLQRNSNNNILMRQQ